MHYYIYDPATGERAHRRLLNKVETEVHNLGLTGERAQASRLKSVAELARDAVRRSYAPLVVVGTDASLSSVINVIVSLGANVPISYVPLTSSPLAGLVGITPEEAVLALSRRIVREVKCARVGTEHFIGALVCRAAPTTDSSLITPTVTLDHGLKVSGTVDELRIEHDLARGRLSVHFVRKGSRGWRHSSPDEASTFWARHLMVTSPKPLLCEADGRSFVRSPLEVEPTEKTVTLVVGRSRQFA